MAEYEVVREVQNLCGNNQMRDVFFAEIETDDPVSWVRGFLKGKDVELTVDEKENGDLTVYAVSGGVSQKSGKKHAFLSWYRGAGVHGFRDFGADSVLLYGDSGGRHRGFGGGSTVFCQSFRQSREIKDGIAGVFVENRNVFRVAGLNLFYRYLMC